jgi:sugar/nucleoside kinase (ribokinase family)
VRPGWIAFFSDEDTPDPEALARHLAASRTLAILTRGHNGATLFELDGTAQHWPALPATPVDPTGAGDCFAAAFMVRLAETDDFATAMRFALAAGALAVEGTGISGLPSRAAVEARMNREAA